MPSTSTSKRLIDMAAPALILLAAALLYGHTLHVPWYLDDIDAIPENFLIRDPWAALGGAFTRRGMLNLSFALNYQLFGLSLPAFHVVNIAIHATAACVAWLILRRLFVGRPAVALLGGLLFVAHPLQTQAVTYVVQRATSLAGLFFLLAFLCYLHARQTLEAGRGWRSPRHLVPYLGAALCGVLAVFTKENAAMLPLVLFAYDRLYPLPQKRSWKRALAYHLPFCLAPLWLAAGVLSAAGGGRCRCTPTWRPCGTTRRSTTW